MGFFNDVKKTLDYMGRNGLSSTIDAVMERMALNRSPYDYVPPDKETLKRQRGDYSRVVFESGRDKRRPEPLKFSILTPLYMTDKIQLAQLIESVKLQSWGGWELLLVDASPKEKSLEATVYLNAKDGRVSYYNLPSNQGISENTNVALRYASGDYVVFLDHDDVLTPDALYETAKAIITCGLEKIGSGVPRYRCVMAYSDEDKFVDERDGERRYFELHAKSDFDFDRLLTNNYICHLTALRSDIAKRLELRSAYDGSQDYDLFLRACAYAVFNADGSMRNAEEVQKLIVHVPKVLYHWRSHALSTASNPSSKTYAYDAGKRAIEDFLKNHFNVGIKVTPMNHLGFYRIDYDGGILRARPDVGVIGGRINDEAGTLTGGKMSEDGSVYYEGLRRGESGGYQHSAVLTQEAAAVDIRNMILRPELEEVFYEVLDKTDINLRNIVTIVNGKVVISDYALSNASAVLAADTAGNANGGVNGTANVSEKTLVGKAVDLYASDSTGQDTVAGAATGAAASATAGEAARMSAGTTASSTAANVTAAATAGTAASTRESTATSANKYGNFYGASAVKHIDISIGDEDGMSLLTGAGNSPGRRVLPEIPSGKKKEASPTHETRNLAGGASLRETANTAGSYADDSKAQSVSVTMMSSQQTSAQATSAEPAVVMAAEASQENFIPTVIDSDTIKKLSLDFCEAVRKRGYRVVWDPQL